jgi:hypothetical protein
MKQRLLIGFLIVSPIAQYAKEFERKSRTLLYRVSLDCFWSIYAGCVGFPRFA